MEPKNQIDLGKGGDYTPSKRASAAVNTAHGNNGSAPDKADSGSVSAPSAADQPSDQHTGGKVMNNTQNNASSMTEPTGQGRGKTEKGTI